MQGRWLVRSGVSITSFGIFFALGLFLFAQEPPPSESGYSGVNQPAPCACLVPPTPEPPAWIKVSEVRLLPQKKIRLEWAAVPNSGSGSFTHTLQDPFGNPISLGIRRPTHHRQPQPKALFGVKTDTKGGCRHRSCSVGL